MYIIPKHTIHINLLFIFNISYDYLDSVYISNPQKILKWTTHFNAINILI